MVNHDPHEVCNEKIQAVSKELCAPDCIASQPEEIPLLALDIGGTFIKLVYYTSDEKNCSKEGTLKVDNTKDIPFLDGQLQFLRFNMKDLDGCLEFIRSSSFFVHFKNFSISRLNGTGSQGLNSGGSTSGHIRILATGGGSFKYEDIFKDRLRVAIKKVDEVISFASGTNFLLKNFRHEAFTYTQGRAEFLDIDPNNLYPYLLVNLGTGTGLLKVTGDNEADMVFGTNFGSGSIYGLAKLLTKCASYEDFLEMSQRGDNSALDLTIGDIYGKGGYPKYHLPDSAVACYFGKVITSEDTSPKKEDIAASLLKGITFQISSIACLMAKLIGSRRIFYGGSHTQNNASVMENIATSIKSLSNGEMQAVFLRHEGFLGAVGALSCHEMINFGQEVENKSSTQISPIFQSVQGSPEAELARLQFAVQKLQIEKEKLQAEIETLKRACTSPLEVQLI